MKEMIYDPAIKDVILLDNGIYKDFKYYIVNRVVSLLSLKFHSL